MHDTAWWSTWQGALMIGLMILIAGLLIWLIARSRTTPGGSGTTGGTPSVGPGDDAVAQARMRYARGEIDRATYAQIVEDLTGVEPEPMAESTTASAKAANPPTPDLPTTPTAGPA
jgi:hypothetical protein